MNVKLSMDELDVTPAESKTTLKTWSIMETFAGGTVFLAALVISFFAIISPHIERRNYYEMSEEPGNEKTCAGA